MSARAYRLGRTLLLALTAGAWIAAAHAASLLEKGYGLSGPRYDAVVPLCDDSGPLSRIQDRFSSKENRFWNSNLAIVCFEGPREMAFMPWVRGSIPRRYCTAVALISDGVKRPIYYSIAEDTGMIGWSWGVEWCVVGLDRNMAYNPGCKMARP